VGDEIVVEIVPDIRDLAGVKHALVFFALSCSKGGHTHAQAE